MINIENQLFLPIRSVLSMNINSRISKLLVSINQSFSGYLIYFYYNIFDRAKEANMYEIKSRKLCSQNFVVVEEELDGINMHDIGNIKDLLIVVFVDGACRYLKLVTDGGDLTRNIN